MLIVVMTILATIAVVMLAAGARYLFAADPALTAIDTALEDYQYPWRRLLFTIGQNWHAYVNLPVTELRYISWMRQTQPMPLLQRQHDRAYYLGHVIAIAAVCIAVWWVTG